MITVCLRSMLLDEYPSLPDESQIPFRAGVIVQDVIESLGILDKDIGIIVVNGLSVIPSHILQDNDKIEIHPYIMGG